MECGGSKTFECEAKNIPLKWTIERLKDINISGPFLARDEAHKNLDGRITTNDSGHTTQIGISNLTISRFTVSDEGGIIKCVNENSKDNNIIGMANISICECVCCVNNAV